MKSGEYLVSLDELIEIYDSGYDDGLVCEYRPKGNISEILSNAYGETREPIEIEEE